MGLTDWVRDKVEDASDFVGKKVTGNYDHIVNCNKCGRPIDIKHGYGSNFKCPSHNCGYVICQDCAENLIEVNVLQNPALFKKGRRQYYLKCPRCNNIIYESDVELFK